MRRVEAKRGAMTDKYSLGAMADECEYRVTIGINPVHLPREYDDDRALLEVSFLPVVREMDHLWACARLRCGDLLLLSNWAMMRRDATTEIALNIVPCRMQQIQHTAECYWKCLFNGAARDLRAKTAALGPGQTLCATGAACATVQ